MKVFIDSPLLIYLNTVADPKTRIIYENFYIDILTRYKPYTDVLVLDELIHVSKKKYGIPYNITIEFIESNVLPYVSVISLGEEEYKQAIKFLLDYNLKPSDSLHLGAMVNNGINTIVSEDSELDKVPIVKRLWV
ncbi:MAG: type II toxin-antitoxin system VapC family toxin [Ignisphaera sp.]|uniref:type II toxin-antitoxin system VapC family toxin n=1 Tax=Desulfurococcus sp. TaxID=51678 RepID=UPI003166D55D